MFDATALGELLIDFTPIASNSRGQLTYEANPGGAPGNVLAMLSKRGKKTAFIGKVGNDTFGRYIFNAVRECGIDVKNISLSNEYPTSLAFISTDSAGEREFTFYRHFGADMMLDIEDIKKFDFSQTKLLHFGTLSMTDDRSMAATKYAIEQAKANHCWLSFDPNIRPLLWNKLTDAVKAMRYGCSVCDILKMEISELKLLTNENNINEAISIIQKEFHIPLVFVTMGKEGSFAFNEGKKVFSKGFVTKHTIDTTGAGDAFFGSCLGDILSKNDLHFDEQEMIKMLKYANAVASFVTTKKGALTIMPNAEEVVTYLRQFGEIKDIL
ncbi:MAG: carbohydrate kinase [Candidatus Izemoplasmatales bacterium]|jgi:fructokinase